MELLVETERLVLRPFTIADVDNLVALDGDPQVMRLRNGGVPTPREMIRDDILPRWISEYDRADVVYRPLETELLNEARRRNCRTLDGGGMLVFQAAGAFEVFTGRRPDADRMFDHLAAPVRSNGDARAAGA